MGSKIALAGVGFLFLKDVLLVITILLWVLLLYDRRRWMSIRHAEAEARVDQVHDKASHQLSFLRLQALSLALVVLEQLAMALLAKVTQCLITVFPVTSST